MLARSHPKYAIEQSQRFRAGNISRLERRLKSKCSGRELASGRYDQWTDRSETEATRKQRIHRERHIKHTVEEEDVMRCVAHEPGSRQKALGSRRAIIYVAVLCVKPGVASNIGVRSGVT